MLTNVGTIHVPFPANTLAKMSKPKHVMCDVLSSVDNCCGYATHVGWSTASTPDAKFSSPRSAGGIADVETCRVDLHAQGRCAQGEWNLGVDIGVRT